MEAAIAAVSPFTFVSPQPLVRVAWDSKKDVDVDVEDKDDDGDGEDSKDDDKNDKNDGNDKPKKHNNNHYFIPDFSPSGWNVGPDDLNSLTTEGLVQSRCVSVAFCWEE